MIHFSCRHFAKNEKRELDLYEIIVELDNMKVKWCLDKNDMEELINDLESALFLLKD